MNSNVLLLNINYAPLAIIRLPRALNLTLQGKAEIIETTGKKIHAGEKALDWPSVIRLHKYYVTVPYKQILWNKRGVLVRDNYQCMYCGVYLPVAEATVDHIIPVSRFDSRVKANTWNNTVCSCHACQRKKANRSLKESGMEFFHKDFTPTTPSNNYMLLHVANQDSWKKFLS